MQTGGGIQNKVLEGMALFVQGSGTIEDGEGLKSEDQYTKIEKNARNLIRNQFTWERYKSVLLETVKDSCFTG